MLSFNRFIKMIQKSNFTKNVANFVFHYNLCHDANRCLLVQHIDNKKNATNCESVQELKRHDSSIS